jgi:hypothetical protein
LGKKEKKVVEESKGIIKQVNLSGIYILGK